MKFVEEPGGMSAVHLNVVELEGDAQSRLQPAFAVAAPHHHRITELVGVLVTMQSSSVAVIADVPITIAPSTKLLWQEILADCVRTM